MSRGFAGRTEVGRRVRVLLIDVDSLRADHTEPYGYARKITPNLADVAREGTTFLRCYASDTPCVPSRAALTTGQFGVVNGAIGNAGQATQIRVERGKYPPGDPRFRADTPLFGGQLASHGIYTASISCFPERHRSYWYIGNFREWRRPTLSLGDDEDARDVTAAALEWIRDHAKDDDWVLHVQFWDPHIPYVEPGDYARRAGEAGPPPGWPDADTILAHREIYGPHTALDLYEDGGLWTVPPPVSPNAATMPDSITSVEDVVKLYDGYDGAILYWDAHLGRIVDELERLDILDGTAIIVTADHGEALGENGVYADHPMVSESIHHVPLIIRWPGSEPNTRGARWGGLMYHLDLCPTLCDLLGIPVPENWHGISVANVVRGGTVDGRSHLVLSHGSYTYQRGVRTADDLYIATRHPGCFRVEAEQLYRVGDDPHMTHNLVDEKPEVANIMRSLLGQWEHQYTRPGVSDGDPMQLRRYETPWSAFSIERYAERLRRTQRDHLARHLLESYGGIS